MPTHLPKLLAAMIAACFCFDAPAQGTLQDYQRAERFVAANIAKLMHRLRLTPRWVGARSDQFWYVEEVGSAADGRKQFVLVDPRAGTVQPAFNHARLAAALGKVSQRHYEAQRLPFNELDELLPKRSLAFTFEGAAWRCDLQRYSCAPAAATAKAEPAEVISPDGRWAVARRGENLLVRDRRAGTSRALTDDGTADHGYAGGSELEIVANELTVRPVPPVVVFSPDSSKIFTYRLDTRAVRKIPLVQVVPGAAPIVRSHTHALSGDREIARAGFMIFDLASGARVDLARSPVPIAATYESLVPEQMRWSAGGARVFYVESDRGHKNASLHAADALTGADTIVATEHSDTAVAVPRFMPVGAGREIVWSSERDGWNHLYLIDGNSGVQRQLTEGEWVVHDIVRVDSQGRWVYFTAGGRERGRDPYYRHLYRVSLEGGAPQLLTPEDADHAVELSPAGNYFVDTYSRMDLPPSTVLRRTDGQLVRELQKADVSQLEATGWRMPERFMVKAADGVTDLYGVIYRPSNFDPKKKYPVIDSVYPGPQVIVTPKTFSPAGRRRSQELPLAELGFIVINMDAKGTPLRSRAFREAAYGKMGYIGGMEDHVVAIRKLGQRYPFMDVERVGIFGHSAGGYAAARAMLLFPDFYKVAVASNGNHDTRGNRAGWAERYQGYPVDDSYDAQSNAPLAQRLRGKLLLVAGTLDDNTNPNHTLSLVDALVAANKDFDLLILPNRDHGLSNLAQGANARDRLDPYFVRKRWDYFVRHLLGVEPPREYRIGADAG